MPDHDDIHKAIAALDDLVYGYADHFVNATRTIEQYHADLAAACEQFLAVYKYGEWTDVDHARHARLHANADGGCHLAITTGARCAGCAAALDKFHRTHGCRPARDGEPTQPA